MDGNRAQLLEIEISFPRSTAAESPTGSADGRRRVSGGNVVSMLLKKRMWL
jgi:hypothetical protein